jgi:hypothetical protein
MGDAGMAMVILGDWRGGRRILKKEGMGPS